MIRKIYEKYKEIILYLLCGGITAAAALGSYILITKVGAIWWSDSAGAPSALLQQTAVVLKNIVAIVISFYTGKYWVFRDRVHGRGAVAVQLLGFAAARLPTFFIDNILQLPLTLAAASLGLGVGARFFTSDLIARLCIEVIIVIVNYLISKFVIFRKGRGENEPTGEKKS